MPEMRRKHRFLHDELFFKSKQAVKLIQMIFKNIYLEILRFFFLRIPFQHSKFYAQPKIYMTDIFQFCFLSDKFYEFEMSLPFVMLTKVKTCLCIFSSQKINDKRLLVIIKAVLGFQHMQSDLFIRVWFQIIKTLKQTFIIIEKESTAELTDA